MVLLRIKEALEKRRQRKEEESRVESYRETEQMRQAEQIKKEADRLAHLKQYKTAIEEYNKALETFPFNEEEAKFRKPAEFFFKIFFNIAASYSFLNKFDRSIKHFDMALAVESIDNENKVKALMNKGGCYYKAKKLLQGDFGEGNYKISEEDDFGDTTKTIESLSKLDSKEGLLNLAWGCFNKAAELERHSADAWYKKGQMEFLMSKVKDAMLSFDRVLEIDQNYENKERIGLFDDIAMEKGIKIKHSEPLDEINRFKTKTGHYVRNKAEKMIADFLFENNLLFQYCGAVSWADKDDFKPLFYVPSLDLYVEHFKFDKIKDYQKLMGWKIKQYEKNKKKLVYTASDEEVNLEEALKIKMKPYIML